MYVIGVYLIRNKLTDECYIGKSVNIESRWNSHRRDMTKKKYTLYSDMRYYGLDFFEFSVIEECGKDILGSREMYWIQKFQDDGYKLYNIIGVPEKEIHYKNRRRTNKRKTAANRR